MQMSSQTLICCLTFALTMPKRHSNITHTFDLCLSYLYMHMYAVNKIFKEIRSTSPFNILVFLSTGLGFYLPFLLLTTKVPNVKTLLSTACPVRGLG